MSSYKLGIYLRSLLKEKKMTVAELSRRTSLSRECIYKLLRGDVRQPELTTIVIISKALRVHPLQLLRQLFDGWEFRNNTTPTAKVSGDGIGFIADVTYPDNSIVCINETFTKVWEIQNTGRQTWRDRRLICLDSYIEVRLVSFEENRKINKPSSPRLLIPSRREIEIPVTCPGESICLSMDFTAPSFPCTTISYWKMVDRNGSFCFPENEGLSCLVQVVSL